MSLSDKFDKYITGQFALNIHHLNDPNEPTGDWHGFIWNNIKELPCDELTYGGKGLEIDTIDIWGDFGIRNEYDHFLNKRIILNTSQIFAANYYRAILDMIYLSIKKYNDILFLNCTIYDHLDNDEQANVIFEKLEMLKIGKEKDIINKIDKWIWHEKNYELIREGKLEIL